MKQRHLMEKEYWLFMVTVSYCGEPPILLTSVLFSIGSQTNKS